MKASARALLVLCVLGALSACSKDSKEKEGQMLYVAQDKAVLQGVTAAVNDVIRSGADCDAAKAAIPEAERLLSEAYGKVKEPVSQETLKVLAAQLKAVRDACP